MDIAAAMLYGLLGLVVGSAINALADDLPYHRRPGRWRCAGCQAPRGPLATLAYVTGRGHCAGCGRPIGLRPVLVELFTALVFVFLWLRAPRGAPWQVVLASFYLSVYILVTVTDVEHRLILNAVMFPAIGLAIVGGLFNANFSFGGALKAGLLALVVLLAMYGLGALVGRLKGLRGVVPFGQGDVTLGVFIGLTTGPAVIPALLIGVFSAGLAALGYVIYQAVFHRRSALSGTMPYGPFLALGGALMVIWGPAVIAHYAA